MFTGIVQTLGQITSLKPTPTGKKLTVTRQGIKGPISHGDSICVSGICLTAVDITPDTLGFDVIHETLAKTKLGSLAQNDQVNLEPAVTPNQPLGGHFMQGHVDGLGIVAAIQRADGEWRITIHPDAAYPELMDYIIPRGSIAIDGVSLTLARVHADSFDVALIPATLELTTLGKLEVGDKVNLEADILAKTIVHQMNRMRKGSASLPRQIVTRQTLEDAGFMTTEASGTSDALPSDPV